MTRRPTTGAATARRHDLDWLRVAAFALLILYHLGMFYVTWDWHVKSTHASRAPEPAMALLNPWRLPLLFFISGVALRFAMDARPLRALLPERLLRLVVPLAFGMLVVVAPQAYFELLTRGEIEPGFLAFYARYLSADGTFSIIVPTWNHLWYVAYMLAYTLALAALSPLLRRLEAPCGGWLSRSLAAAPWSVLVVPAIPFVFYRLGLEPSFPTTHALVDDWANHANSFSMVLVGWFAAKSPAFREAVRRSARSAAVVALACGAVLFAARMNIEAVRGSDTLVLVLGTVRVFYAWAVIVALLALAGRFLDRPSPALTYLTEAILPYYILHQTIIVAAGFWLAGLLLPPWTEFGLIALATVAGCVLGHELIVRRSALLRPLFGLRPRPRDPGGLPRPTRADA